MKCLCAAQAKSNVRNQESFHKIDANTKTCEMCARHICVSGLLQDLTSATKVDEFHKGLRKQLKISKNFFELIKNIACLPYFSHNYRTWESESGVGDRVLVTLLLDPRDEPIHLPARDQRSKIEPRTAQIKISSGLGGPLDNRIKHYLNKLILYHSSMIHRVGNTNEMMFKYV